MPSPALMAFWSSTCSCSIFSALAMRSCTCVLADCALRVNSLRIAATSPVVMLIAEYLRKYCIFFELQTCMHFSLKAASPCVRLSTEHVSARMGFRSTIFNCSLFDCEYSYKLLYHFGFIKSVLCAFFESLTQSIENFTSADALHSKAARPLKSVPGYSPLHSESVLLDNHCNKSLPGYSHTQ